MNSEDVVTKPYLDEALDKLLARIAETVYDSETRLLRAFADYNANANIRFRKLESDVGNIDTSSTLRLGKLEEKITDLEIRLLKLEDRPPHRAA
jgi:hypothetical protein